MESKRYLSRHINKYDIEISNKLFDCRVFWARVISSENESLFTQYTKHTFYEIQYALDGSIHMTLGQNGHALVRTGEFMIIPPDTYHQIADGDSIGARFIMAFDIRPRSDAASSVLRRLSIPECHRESPAMRPLLSLILEKSYLDNPLRKGSLNALIESLLFEMLEALNDRQPLSEQEHAVSDPSSPHAKRILSFIREYNGIGICVSDVAAHFHISERHLNRILHAATGRTVREQLHYEKIKRVEALVATTSLSLNEISELCGFSDEYAMNKFFRRHTQSNLSDFRKIAKKSPQQSNKKAEE